MSGDLQLVLSIIALIGVIFAPVVTGAMSERQARRRERHNYIDNIVKSLIEVRANLQYYRLSGEAIYVYPSELQNATDEVQRQGMLNKFIEIIESDPYKQMEINLGRAYSIMISVDDPEIRARAKQMLDERLSPRDRIAPIDFALEQLGKKYGFKE